MGVIAELEAQLRELRAAQAAGDRPVLRTSVLTHVAWVPEDWLAAAEETLAGLAERHPSRTILLVPLPEAPDGVDGEVSVRCFAHEAGAATICSEVIRLRLRGRATQAPASLVVPLLIPDLPAFCRWRGRPDFDGEAFRQLVGVVDRLVVDSAEWPDVPAAYARLAACFDDVAVSDIAWTRTRPWRGRVAELWPGVADAERVAVRGPYADALLLAGWLRSRLRREVALEHEPAEWVERIAVDGAEARPPRGKRPTASDLLSEELDVFGRDPIYEDAVRALLGA